MARNKRPDAALPAGGLARAPSTSRLRCCSVRTAPWQTGVTSSSLTSAAPASPRLCSAPDERNLPVVDQLTLPPRCSAFRWPAATRCKKLSPDGDLLLLHHPAGHTGHGRRARAARRAAVEPDRRELAAPRAGRLEYLRQFLRARCADGRIDFIALPDMALPATMSPATLRSRLDGLLEAYAGSSRSCTQWQALLASAAAQRDGVAHPISASRSASRSTAGSDECRARPALRPWRWSAALP